MPVGRWIYQRGLHHASRHPASLLQIIGCDHSTGMMHKRRSAGSSMLSTSPNSNSPAASAKLSGVPGRRTVSIRTGAVDCHSLGSGAHALLKRA